MNSELNNFDPANYNNALACSNIDEQSFDTIYIKDIIDNEIKSLIYDNIKDKTFDDGIYQPFVGHIAYRIEDSNIKNIISQKANDIAQLNNIIRNDEYLILTECSFAKYTPMYGNKPKLFPHFDTHYLDGQRITIDIQLDSNIEWPVVVEGKKFNIKQKDAILFYGTQQMHWREKRDIFQVSDFSDMLFCHFSFNPKRDWNSNQKQVLEYRSHRLRELLDISNVPEPFDIIDNKGVFN